MAQYISKDALVAEIERRIKEHHSGYLVCLKDMLSFLNALEVKEVDLDKETTHYLLYEHHSPLNEIMHKADLKSEMQYHKDIENTFKAGFELGISVSNKAQKREDVDAQINSQNNAIKNLNSALNSMEHGGHLPLVEDNMILDKYIYGKEPEIVDIDDLPLDTCNIQYTSIDGAIKAHAEDYSFNIESELFPQLTKEQQALWRKEIEQAVISGGYSGLNLAKDSRYKENLEAKEVDDKGEWKNTGGFGSTWDPDSPDYHPD